MSVRVYGNPINVSSITVCTIYENALKSARTFRQMQLERISKTISTVNPNELAEYLFNGGTRELTLKCKFKCYFKTHEQPTGR